MNKKNFVLSYYENAKLGMHIKMVNYSREAQNPHTHEYYQIYYVIKGSLEHFTENDSSVLSQGDMFIIPPKSMHYIRQADDAVFYSFSFTLESLGNMDSVNKLSLNFLRTLSENKFVRAKVSLPENQVLNINSIMEKLYKEFNEQALAYGEVMRACAIILITLLARVYYQEQSNDLVVSNVQNRQQVMYCIDYVKQNYSENFSLTEMVKMSAMSKSVFCKLFKETSGRTFNQFVNYTKIQTAKELLKKGYLACDVCSMVGYNDFATFFRNFKKFTGKSPECFKQTCQSKA